MYENVPGLAPEPPVASPPARPPSAQTLADLLGPGAPTIDEGPALGRRARRRALGVDESVGAYDDLTPAAAPSEYAQVASQPPNYPDAGASFAPEAVPVRPAGFPAPRPAAPGLAPDLHGADVALDPLAPSVVPAVEIRKSEASASDYQRGTTEDQLRPDDFALSDALMKMLEMKGSDLHLTAGAPPTVRVDGSLRPIPGTEPLTPEIIRRVMYAICTQQQRERFEAQLELDFSYSLPDAARFRVNMYRQRDCLGAAFRVIPYEIKTLEALGMPPVLANFAAYPRGFVLVTGPTGSGKSTTLAALVDLANRSRYEHIMTVEDPIEFLHPHKNCLVNQREVGEDTLSFANALKHVLRQDPDIILVGEMRDLETISVALTAAETGHLVYATLHTQDAAQTVDRVIDVFPPSQQQQIRQQLAGTLQAIVCQTLCKTANGRGRVAATEVLVATPAIRNLIREGKTHQIYSALQAGASHGMHTLDQHLAELVKAGQISLDTGYEKCHHVEDFARMVGRPAPKARS